ncbi:ABC transporter permease [Runella sp.]|uniref:ABC transporter permease n=1 Tax=Runella sp. TaxID=1960881 RepID=UPI003D0E7F84
MLKFAVRNLLKTRLFGILNITGLAVGMAAAVLILMWVQNELSFDSYHTKASRTYQIITHNQVNKEETWHWASTPLPLAAQAKRLPEVEKVTRVIKSYYNGLPVRIGDKLSNEKNVACVDENWFEVFDYTFTDGNPTDFVKNIRSVALTESKALQLFGQTKVAGKIIRIDTLDYVVRAVIKDNPTNSSFRYDFLLPLAVHLSNPDKYKNDNNWNNFNYETFLLLRPDANLKKINGKLTNLTQVAKKDTGTGKVDTSITLEVEPIREMHFDTVDRHNTAEQGDKKTVYIFFGLALVILLTACINYVNLTTARASIRAKEVSVKKLIGAAPSQLFAQFMIESSLMCLAALVFSLLLVYGFLPVFNELTGQTFQLDFSNSALWSVLLGTTLLAIVLTGVYPAVLLSSFQPIRALRGFNVLGTNNSTFRKSLVVVQFTVSIVFLVATLVVYQQIRFIRNTKLGYDRAHLFEFTIPWDVKPKVDATTFKSRLLNESSVEDVTISSQNIVEIKSSHSGSLDWDGRPADFQPTVAQISVEPNYQKMFNLKMADGRWFAENSTADQENVVLNEAAVKKFKLRTPVVGQRFHFQGHKGIVMGVVKDFHYKSLREKIEPLVLFNNPGWRSGIYIKAVAGKESEAIRAAEKVWAELIPSRPLEYRFLDETFDRLYRTEQRTATLFNAFAVIAVLISCLGLFGLATFTAEMRTKEIGIRKVLGATVLSITTLLSKDFLKLVVVGIVIASPIAYYAMEKWLQDFAYRIQIGWWVFALAGILSILIALITVSYQAIRTALLNPSESLKSE